MRNKHVRLCALALVSSLLVACGGLSSKHKAAADNALKALQKLSAATEIRVSQQNYQQLLIEAKTQVNEAVIVLPDGELKKEISAAMDAYADAGDAWAAFIREGTGNEQERFLLLNKIASWMPDTEGQATARRLKDKYKLETIGEARNGSGSRDIVENQEGAYMNSIIKSKTLPVIWGAAKEHVDRASKLLNQ